MSHSTTALKIVQLESELAEITAERDSYRSEAERIAKDWYEAKQQLAIATEQLKEKQKVISRQNSLIEEYKSDHIRIGFLLDMYQANIKESSNPTAFYEWIESLGDNDAIISESRKGWVKLEDVRDNIETIQSKMRKSNSHFAGYVHALVHLDEWLESLQPKPTEKP